MNQEEKNNIQVTTRYQKKNNNTERSELYKERVRTEEIRVEI